MADILIVYSGMQEDEDAHRVALKTKNEAQANAYRFTISQVVKDLGEVIPCFVGDRDPQKAWKDGPHIVRCCDETEASRQIKYGSPVKQVRNLDFD